MDEKRLGSTVSEYIILHLFLMEQDFEKKTTPYTHRAETVQPSDRVMVLD